MKTDFAILVFACDRYQLLYRGFDYFFKKHWDNNVPLNRYFATEESELDLDGYTHLKSGKGAWSNRLKKVLAQIEQQYIIFFQEDMWLYAAPKPGALENILSYTCDNEIQLLKLHSSEVYKTKATADIVEGLQVVEVHKASGFLMSHQVSVWNKDFLIEQLKDNENPWRNERRGTKRLKKSDNTIYQIDLLSENGKPPINANNTEHFGGYFTVSQNACLFPRTQPFIDELKKVHPKYAQKLQQHLNSQITHDGLPKPRKIDPFKRFKNWIKGKTS